MTINVPENFRKYSTGIHTSMQVPGDSQTKYPMVQLTCPLERAVPGEKTHRYLLFNPAAWDCTNCVFLLHRET
jgi:hypothetical protein